MYTIYLNGELLHAPNLVREGYGVLSPKLELELNRAGSITFTVPVNNATYSNVYLLSGIITVFANEEEIFRGRILEEEKDFYNRSTVYGEGELSFLLDSTQRPFSIQGSIPQALKFFLDNHNAQVEKEKQFQLGRVTVKDNNNYINRSSTNYINTLEAITSRLLETHGGYFRTRGENGIRYLDYIETYGNYNAQTIDVGKNLLDITTSMRTDGNYSILIPLGAKDAETEKYVTIASANNGLDYLVNPHALGRFGHVSRVKIWEDITLPNNLLSRAKDYFTENHAIIPRALDVRAVDLSLLDTDIERIKLGDYIGVRLGQDAVGEGVLCSKISLDLTEPQNTVFTLGEARTGLIK
jgi:hypothetical protein